MSATVPQTRERVQSHSTSSLQYTPKQYDFVPNGLKVLPHWGTFRLARAEDDTLAKVPVGGFTSTDPATHQSYTAALAALGRKRGHVLGFAMPADRSLTGLDFDHCLDADGAILPWAAPYLTPFIGRTYTEITPSGEGLRVYVRGQKPGAQCKYYAPDGGVIELYDHERLFTVTGNRYQDAPVQIAELQDALDALYAALFPARAERPAQNSGQPITLSDQALLDKAMKDSTFAALWRGEWAGKPSASEADAALAYRLAWWTDSDTAQMERLMRGSGLPREKWEKKDGQYGTHLARTIAKAIEANGGRCYSGAKADFRTCQDDTRENDTPAQETSAASPDCDAKDKIIAQLRRELAKERERVKQLEGELAWERKMRANKHLSPAQKIVGSVLREQWQKAAAKGAQDEIPVHLPTLAKQTGLSERTVSTTIVQFHAMGAAKREEKHPIAETGPNKGKRVTRIYVDPRPLLAEPEAMQPEKPRNHGGRRVCPECGSKHLRVRIRAQVTCMECGNKWETESAERILRGDDAEMAAQSDAMLAGDVFGGCQDDTCETLAAADENCRLTSVQIRGGNPFTPADDIPGMNHHDERAEMLALVQALGWQTRIPVGLENVGGTEVRWRDFATRADNTLIDDTLHSLRIRAAALREQVS